MPKGLMSHKGKKESVATTRKHKQELESDEASVPVNAKTNDKPIGKTKGRKYVPLKDLKKSDFLKV